MIPVRNKYWKMLHKSDTNITTEVCSQRREGISERGLFRIATEFQRKYQTFNNLYIISYL
jgi:hypothetical protein